MSLPDVTPEQILNAIQHVPTGRWGEALRAIESLQNQPGSTSAAAPNSATGADFQDSALIGAWADRRDIVDNHEFARKLRQEAEQRK